MADRPSQHRASALAPSATPAPCEKQSTGMRPVEAMGLQFPNPVGLAAGFDRTGERVPSLVASGFGHIEIGTITSATDDSGPSTRSSGNVRLGVNIGSLRPGLDNVVIEDFVARLRQAARIGDYAVANLTAPTIHRNGNSPGVERLLHRLSEVRDELANASAHRLPLLIKLDGGEHGTPIPAAIIAARLHGLDGIVLVSNCLKRLNEISYHIAPLTVISVGGVRSYIDVRARLAAGAALVQVHRAFAEGGEKQIRSILGGL